LGEADISTGGQYGNGKLAETIECEGDIEAEIYGRAVKVSDYLLLEGFEKVFIVLRVLEIFQENGFDFFSVWGGQLGS